MTHAVRHIPYGRQSLNSADIEAVAAVLRSDFLTQGPAVPAFESAVTGYCGAPYGVAVNSATSALHLACRALDVGPGDLVWTTPNTFVASANCARYCGADVDFVDIDARTYNMSAAALASRLEAADRAGRLPKVVIPVDFAGQPCDLDEIAALAGHYGFRIIEDASHAIGARYRDSPIGGTGHADAVVFSFHPVKIITTAEGGLVTTADGRIGERLALLRSHGITREASLMENESEGGWYYEQLDLGYNYRMTDVQAALGTSQMQRLEEFVARRAALAHRYDALLADLPLVLPYQAPNRASAWHLYVIRLQLDQMRKSRRQVFEALRADGIGVNVHYIPVHTQPYYTALGFGWGQFPQAEQYYREAISLPLFPDLSDEDQDRVVAALKEAIA